MNAVSETNRRRAIQQAYNEEHGIVPKTIIKQVKNVFETLSDSAKSEKIKKLDARKLIDKGDAGSMSDEDKTKLIARLTKEMKAAAKDLDFEKAAELRDVIISLKGNGGK